MWLIFYFIFFLFQINFYYHTIKALANKTIKKINFICFLVEAKSTTVYSDFYVYDLRSFRHFRQVTPQKHYYWWHFHPYTFYYNNGTDISSLIYYISKKNTKFSDYNHSLRYRFLYIYFLENITNKNDFRLYENRCKTEIASLIFFSIFL